MKAKLLELDLSEILVDEILNIFDNYEKTLKRYSKPAGSIALSDNMSEIISLSSKLKKRLDKLSVFEQQILNDTCSPNIFDLKSGLIRLKYSCEKLQKTKTKFSRKEPLIRTLATELLEVLVSHGYKIKIYRGNIFIKVLDILLAVNDDDVDDARSLNILRTILKA